MDLISEYFQHILKQKPATDPAKRILFNLLSDLEDRRGLSQEWEQIDNDIQNEILETWLKIIRKELPKKE